VKSCAGTSLDQATVGLRGIEHDREFMLVGADRRFLTQRELPRLALSRPSLHDGCLRIEAPGLSPLEVTPSDNRRSFEVVVWRDTVMAVDQGNEAAEWFSTFLGTEVRLVKIADDTVRAVDPVYAPRASDQVGLADGYPLLLVSEESLQDLNKRLAQPLPMNRFRPNVVVRGWGVPFGEDTWGQISIGTVIFDVVKGCARCSITTTDQATAERGAEPLATLATYRRVPRGVLFGQNLVHQMQGTLQLGDPVRVLRPGATGVARE
jgi:uncharacterized protein YcbX